MPKDMSVLDQRKSNPNGDEDENHNNTPRRTMPRSNQVPEQSSDTSEMGEEEMNSEEALEVLSESLGLTQHRTDRSRITAPQGATEMPQPQNCGNNTFGFVIFNFSESRKIPLFEKEKDNLTPNIPARNPRSMGHLAP